MLQLELTITVNDLKNEDLEAVSKAFIKAIRKTALTLSSEGRIPFTIDSDLGEVDPHISVFEWTKDLYRVKDVDGEYLRRQMDKPVSDDNPPIRYTRGEAIKKAKLFNGKIEIDYA